MKLYRHNLSLVAKTASIGLIMLGTYSCSMNEQSEQKKSAHHQPPANKQNHWRSLINENSLSDWYKIGGKADYQLEAQTIVGTSIKTPHSTYFTTGEVFTDFIFEVDVQAQAPLNSGVQFRSKKILGKKGETVAGYQMEIDTAKRAWSGGIYDQGRRGWLYTMNRNPDCQKTFKVDNWNKYRIEAVGSQVRTFINGVPCSSIVDDWSKEGFIALQIHSAGADKANKTIKWRAPKILTTNIKAHLSAPSKIAQFNYLNNNLTDYQASQGWQLLWDGQTNIPLAQTGQWQVKDGALTANAAKQDNTLSLPIKDHYFELELDVKSSKQADNGIHYLLQKDNKGYEFQLSEETSLEQTANNTKAMGAIYGITPPTNLTEPKGWRSLRINKGWNRVRLVVKGSQVEHWINNIKVAEQQFLSPIPEQLTPIKIENSKGTLSVKNLKLRQLTKPKADKPFKASNPGDRKGHVMKKVVPEEIIPEAPILNIEQALQSFEVHPDFALEVIADSPLVYDPVYAIYDAAGRVWALEMTTYMMDTLATGEMKHDSQIVMLSDTNNDGTMDTRQVVIPNIVLPRALAFVPKGIIWADNSSMYFSELTEDKGQVTVVKTEMVDKDYAKGGNVEHKPNGLLFSLDNWYYSAKANKRYRPYPLNAELPKGSKEIYKNQYWKMIVAHTEFRGQWGITQDDYGRHYFLGNSSPLQTTSFLPNVAFRNPQQEFPKELLNQNVGSNEVFPIRVTPGINRGYMEGMYDKEYKLKRNTAAGGPVIYRGNQFPAPYQNIGLVTESAGNLVKATKISESEGKVTGANLFNKKDIIASTDERFRPVSLNNTPDGTVMVVDFYHGVLQHRTFLTSYLSDQIKSRDLERSKHIGRLYRLKHKTNPMPKVEYLHNLTAQQLVPFLSHDNGWHRDMAQQLLVMAQDKSVVTELISIATESPNPLAQIKALWALEGLEELSLNTLIMASNSTNSKVLRSVYRLAELFSTTPELNNWLHEQSVKVSAEAANALALAAGTHNVWTATANIIQQHGNNPIIVASLGNKGKAFLASQKNELSTDVVKTLTALNNTVKQTKQKLNSTVSKSVARGKKLYNGEAGCFGCHGANGEGNPMIPPLNKSEWVTGDPNKLIGILLHGYSGPIKVRGKTYNNGMVMPGLGQNSHFSDAHIADIASYIRNAWDNSTSAIKSSKVSSVRHHTQQQSLPYTNKTVQKIKAH
ncbi:PVC-type heme-binding CxxCH protein [Paraglaciecola sp.]|uniref:PVC-type heme-binding CxxCH protein n=1 Tax=Paraglaciecola sp. TaxID=1920173 RepID=UPI003EF8FF4E